MLARPDKKIWHECMGHFRAAVGGPGKMQNILCKGVCHHMRQTVLTSGWVVWQTYSDVLPVQDVVAVTTLYRNAICRRGSFFCDPPS
jgi:hypothetical protein